MTRGAISPQFPYLPKIKALFRPKNSLPTDISARRKYLYDIFKQFYYTIRAVIMENQIRIDFVFQQ